MGQEKCVDGKIILKSYTVAGCGNADWMHGSELQSLTKGG
jgi:hypothetical protein